MRYNFKKPIREASTSEQVGSISIFDFEEEKQKDNLQQHQEAPSQQEEPTQEQTPEKVHIPNKKHIKRKNQQVMATTLQGKKVQIHQDDEVRYIFTPIEHSHNINLKNILFWTSFREERIWTNRISLVGMFKVEWKTPYHNILVEFLNNWTLGFEHNKIKFMMAKKQKIIYRHFLV